jgi:hypothetical protein
MSGHREAFERVREQVGACGIWCGSCAVGNGTLQELSHRYRTLLQDYDVAEYAPGGFDWAEFMRGVEGLEMMSPCPGCRRGGGRDDCELRSCAEACSLEDCLGYHARAYCPHRELLEHMRSGAARVGLMVKGEGEAPLAEWLDALVGSWPCAILFDGHLKQAPAG